MKDVCLGYVDQKNWLFESEQNRLIDAAQCRRAVACCVTTNC
jgi:hypothetical protein